MRRLAVSIALLWLVAGIAPALGGSGVSMETFRTQVYVGATALYALVPGTTDVADGVHLSDFAFGVEAMVTFVSTIQYGLMVFWRAGYDGADTQPARLGIGIPVSFCMNWRNLRFSVGYMPMGWFGLDAVSDTIWEDFNLFSAVDMVIGRVSFGLTYQQNFNLFGMDGMEQFFGNGEGRIGLRMLFRVK